MRTPIRHSARALALTAAVAFALPAPASAVLPDQTVLLSRPGGVGPLTPGENNNGRVARTDVNSQAFFLGRDRAGESISSNGRWVVFTSQADNLLGTDDNRYSNVYVRDTHFGITELISVSSSEQAALGDSGNPAISADGNFVAFVSTAGNLAEAGITDPNGGADVYVRDRAAGTTKLVSRRTGETQSAGGSNPSISSDGNEIVFETATALDTVDDTNGTSDIYRRVVTTATTTLVSRVDGGTSTAAGNGFSDHGSISDDGNLVAFETNATDMSAGDTNNRSDIHLRNISTGETRLISAANDSGGNTGAVGSTNSNNPAISATGSHVAFDSPSTNLVTGDTNGTSDVFVRSVGGAVGTRTTTRASVQTGGSAQSTGTAQFPAISSDGGEVAFHSTGNDLVPNSFNGRYDVFVRDYDVSTTTLTSRANNADGAIGDDDSQLPSMSSDGVDVSFQSDANNLSAGNPDDFTQVFKRDSQTVITDWVSRPHGTGSVAADPMNHSWLRNGEAGTRAVSGDGRYVAFLSAADDLVPGQNNRVTNAFRRDVKTSELVQLNRSSAGVAGNSHAYAVAISDDGQKVAFSGGGSNLGDGATDGGQTMWRDLTTGATKRLDRASGASGTLASSLFLSATDIAISGDGNRVAFTTPAPNIHPGGPAADSNSSTDVYVRDVPSNTTFLGSAANGGGLGTGGAADNPSLDEDGSKLAFNSTATNLVAGDAGGFTDVFVHDLGSQSTIMASRSTGGAQANNDSYDPSISADGTRLAFTTEATNIATGDSDTIIDVVLRDTAGPSTTLVSRPTATPGSEGGNRPSISADGTRIAFESSFPYEGAESNARSDVFVRNTTAATTKLASRPSGTGAAGTSEASGDPSISADGNCVVFESQSENLTSDYPGRDFSQVYMRGLSGECPDSTPPDTQIDSGPADTTDDRTPTFGFSSAEAGATFECRITFTGGPATDFGPCTGPGAAHTPAADLADGQYTFEVRALDTFGNADATPASRTFTVLVPGGPVDTTPPETTLTGPPALTRVRRPTFTYAASEPGPAFVCRLDGVVVPCTGTSFTPDKDLADGPHTFEVVAFDAAGNGDPTAAVSQFVVDATAPRLSKGKRTSKAFTFRLTEAGSTTINIDSVLPGRLVGKKCRPPTRANRTRKACERYANRGKLTHTSKLGANSVAFSGKIKKKALSAGRYRARIVTTDAAGNVSKTLVVRFTIRRR